MAHYQFLPIRWCRAAVGLDAEHGKRFEAYVDRMADAVGHADRREPTRAYGEGLILPGDRKGVEPMAARVDPLHVRSRHQSMHHFMADAPGRDEDHQPQSVLEVAKSLQVGAWSQVAWAEGARSRLRGPPGAGRQP